MYLTFLGLIGGALLLYFGAEGLIRGSSSIALRAGISQLMIGLTVVAYGTSTPELIVSIDAALTGHGDIAIGNVIGSNIFNVAVILGITALIQPMKVQLQLIKIDMPIMLTVSVLFLVLYLHSSISRLDGLLLVMLLIAYTMLCIYLALHYHNRAAFSVNNEAKRSGRSILIDIVMIVSGLLILVGGAHLFVTAAISLARLLGVSEAVIGLTIVAGGTSLPELAASIVAACKGNSDIAVGNIIGSNIYNILAIIGFSGLIHPLSGMDINMIDFFVMIGLGVLLWFIAAIFKKVTRWEGLLLALIYIVYIYHLWPE